MKKIILIIAAIAMAMSLNSCQDKKTESPRAKYIFLMIGDGMGASHVAVAESYLSAKAGKIGGEQLTMTQFPYYGTCTTHCLDKTITCSAASGTAIASGQKTLYSRLGCDADFNRLESMAFPLKEEGYKIGIMSSVPITHATPAAFYASTPDRGDGYGIMKQIPDSGFDFFGGSGFEDMFGKDGQQLGADKYLEQHGYEVCFGPEEFLAAADTCERIVFCQQKSKAEDAKAYVSEEADAEDITLAEMLQLAIDYLGDEEPFFIMCEGGDIDWESHSSYTMPMIEKVISFDNAIAVAYEFYKAHPEETLIVVTADHETGGVAIGQGESWSNTFIDWIKIEEEWEKNKEKYLQDSKANREFNEASHIGWTTSYHTGGAVPVYSIGKGAEKFMGRIDNADIKGKILGK
ncbi:MAG: alkaline phosphatase [Bacteroidales bacterium]|nr:alkaline phosphatase [Bacteroidales bacterium]